MSFGDPGAPQGTPKGAQSKKLRKCWFVDRLLASPWGPFGDNFRYFLCFFDICSVYFFEALFLRLLESLGTHSNRENDGFVCTKPLFSHFHLEPPNHRNLFLMGTFWNAFGWFSRVVGHHLGDEEIVPEIGRPKVTREIKKFPEVPGSFEIDPVFPIRFT